VCNNFSSLDIKLSPEVSHVGFEALSHLSKLRELLFFEHMSNLELNKWVPLCFDFLPHLWLAGRTFSAGGFLQQGYHNKALLMKKPSRLNLQELGLVCAGSGGVLDEALMGCELPELRALYLTGPNTDVHKLFDRSPNISTIAFICTRMDVIESILQHMGRRLTSLTVRNAMPKFLLENIAGLCPNLKVLKLKFCINDVWNLPAGCFQLLEQVELEVFIFSGCNAYPPGIIMQVRHNLFTRDYWGILLYSRIMKIKLFCLLH
jgi:hypothetical protein